MHLWRLDEQRVALEAHVAVKERDLESIEEIKSRVKAILREDFQIEHSTLEVEIAGRPSDDRQAIARE